MNFILFFLHGECKHALFQYIPVVVVAVQPRLFKRLIVLANKQAQCVVFIPCRKLAVLVHLRYIPHFVIRIPDTVFYHIFPALHIPETHYRRHIRSVVASFAIRYDFFRHLRSAYVQLFPFIPFQLVQPRFYRDSARRYARTRFPTCIAPMSLHKIAEFALFANSAINR